MELALSIIDDAFRITNAEAVAMSRYLAILHRTDLTSPSKEPKLPIAIVRPSFSFASAAAGKKDGPADATTVSAAASLTIDEHQMTSEARGVPSRRVIRTTTTPVHRHPHQINDSGRVRTLLLELFNPPFATTLHLCSYVYLGEAGRCSTPASMDGHSMCQRMLNDALKEASMNGRLTFYKLPHKDGEKANVGNPLAKTFMTYAQDGTLASPGHEAKDALDMNAQRSYWINHQRIFTSIKDRSSLVVGHDQKDMVRIVKSI
ncbi:hypothetical protein A0H81_05448 [Grifola frondosa]|uniref:Uncharacterized protein n=1 Tax=Grifola frondosa TaxID=5627 RepID=A0A1C7MBM2_GRIFR|nr:hypothetical protein A0H81_05448 [Grifola frondosa]